jgi:hypothetical protein
LSAVAGLLLSTMMLSTTMTFAGVQGTPTLLQYSGLSNPQELCKVEVTKRIAGEPAPNIPLVRGPIYVQYFQGSLPEEPNRKLVLALFSFEPLAARAVEDRFGAILDALGYYVNGRLVFETCKVYSKSAQDHLSFPHKHLLDARWYSGSLIPPSFRVLPVYAYYKVRVPPVVGSTSRPAPGSDGAVPKNDKTAARAPQKNGKDPKQNPTAGGARDAEVPATSEANRAPGSNPPPAPIVTPASTVPKGDSVAVLQPSTPRSDAAGRPPEVQRKSLKRYPRPNYKGGAEPLRTTKDTAKRIFAVEEIQCGEDGNWLIGYVGNLVTLPDGDVKILLTQRHALNNYPGERLATLETLREDYALTGGLECDSGWRECYAPTFLKEAYHKYRQALLTMRKLGGGSVSDQPRYSCRPDKGVCVSQERDYWRCDLDGNCLSYDPTRWWCAWRQEFCFSRVKFGDWASPIKENDVIQLKLDGAETELAYNMSDGFLRIAQDALTRVCGSGETKVWKAHWAGLK